MKISSIFYFPVLLASLASAQVITYRPSSDADSRLPFCGAGTYQASGQPQDSAYDTLGSDTSATFALDQSGAASGLWQQRIVTGFPPTSGTHQSVVLVVDSSASGYEDSQSSFSSKLAYSTDGGSTYKTLHSTGFGWFRTVDQITLAPDLDISNIRILMCDRAIGHGASAVEIDVADIRVDITN